MGLEDDLFFPFGARQIFWGEMLNFQRGYRIIATEHQVDALETILESHEVRIKKNEVNISEKRENFSSWLCLTQQPQEFAESNLTLKSSPRFSKRPLLVKVPNVPSVTECCLKIHV